MLFGLSILYGISGSMDIAIIAESVKYFDSSLTIYIAMLFILVGFGYKISMVPFHYWTPDVYQGSPITVTAFLSVAPKAAGFAILIRFFYSIFTAGPPSMLNNSEILGLDWTLLIAVMSALTMTVGNVLALKQTNIKRLIQWKSSRYLS